MKIAYPIRDFLGLIFGICPNLGSEKCKERCIVGYALYGTNAYKIFCPRYKKLINQNAI